MTQTNKEYISPCWPKFRSLWWIVTIILFILLLLLWLLGYGPGGTYCQAPGPGGQIVKSIVPAPDTTAPTITLNAPSEIHLVEGSDYRDAGAVATDLIDGSLTVSKSGTVNTGTPGEYTITYTATDTAGNTATATRTVIVQSPEKADTAKPVVTLTGPSEIRITAGDDFNDPGAVASDDVDGTITVEKSGRVDTATAGEYTITYTATDAAGNTATATRTVIVQSPEKADTAKPVVTVSGPSEIRITAGDDFNDPGAVASDDVDGTITVEKSGRVDTATAGEYTITYTATDAAGNIATRARTVIVEKAPVPPDARLYFKFDDAESPYDRDQTLPPVVDYLRSHGNSVAIVSGFHDSKGNYAYNQDLARRRAESVRRLMQTQGVAADRITTKVHGDATGSGSQKDARRVEVTIRDHR